MFRRSKLPAIIVFLILLILIAAVLLPGCRGYEIINDNTDYNLFIMKKGIAAFSFEYNDSNFRIGYIRTDDKSTTIHLYGPTIAETIDFTFILIEVEEFSDSYKDYIQVQEELIQVESWLTDYTLHVRIPVAIAGESGDYIVYSYNNDPSAEQTLKGIVSPAPQIVRRVLFEHDNLLWYIWIYSPESTYKSDIIEFQHLLSTFRIQDL